jgi:class 3 adenylate cyclase/pimeloyl-ACP methyl ester carboxylesterase
MVPRSETGSVTFAIPDTRYARSGDVHIAYRRFGGGELNLVVIPALISNVDLEYRLPGVRTAEEVFGSFARGVIFDKRGIGVSDHVAGAPSLEARMDDLRAVMDANGMEAAALLGVFDGGAMSLLFAATYPERTFALVLESARPRFTRTADFPWAPTRAEYDRETDEIVRNWGTVEYEERIQTDAAWETARERAWRLRLSASPGAVDALRRMNADVDVRPVLPAIHVPTLVVSRPAEIDVGRYVVDRLPNAQHVEASARVHPLDLVELAPRIRDFLDSAWVETQRRASEPHRVLATVLFTDLVGSTARAAEFGPRWPAVLSDHNARVRRELARFNGREIDTAGDGFFASGFDGPARAIRCGCAIRDAVSEVGLAIRVGIHTGECEVVDGKLSGLAVAIGARVADHADEGEVLVSGTVRDLVAGSGIEFEPRGGRELKGLGEWPLYAVTAA